VRRVAFSPYRQANLIPIQVMSAIHLFILSSARILETRTLPVAMRWQISAVAVTFARYLERNHGDAWPLQLVETLKPEREPSPKPAVESSPKPAVRFNDTPYACKCLLLQFSNFVPRPLLWVGLFKSYERTSYVSYKYLPRLEDQELNYTLPNLYGTFEFRVMDGKSPDVLARSDPVIIGPIVSLITSSTDSPESDFKNNDILVTVTPVNAQFRHKKDYVGLFRIEDRNNRKPLKRLFVLDKPLVFHRSDDQQEPKADQQYDVRYIPSQYFSHNHTAKSEPFMFPPQNQFVLPVGRRFGIRR